MSKWIDALLAERTVYENKGLKDRVKEVDAALRELGFDNKYMSEEVETAAVEPVLETAILNRGKKKKA